MENQAFWPCRHKFINNSQTGFCDIFCFFVFQILDLKYNRSLSVFFSTQKQTKKNETCIHTVTEVDQSYTASSEEGAFTLFSKNFNASQCLKVKFLFVQWSKFGGLVLLLFLLKSSQYPSVMYVKLLVAYLLQTSDRFVVLCGISTQSYWFVLPSVC